MVGRDRTGAGSAPRLRGSFPAFVCLYGTLYAAYGIESPFLPSFLGERGLSPGEIGLALAAGTVVRLAAAPVAGHLADRFDAARAILGLAAAAAGLISFAYLAGSGFWPMLAVGMAHSVVIAVLAPLADALALTAAERERSFSYGWVRGAGSAAFVLGTLAAGQLVASTSLGSVIVASGLSFLAMAAAATRVPDTPPRREETMPGLSGLKALLGRPRFCRLLLVAALVIGSHSLNDAFAVIRWREAGLGPGTISLLWSESVASEVLVFVVVGQWLLRRLGPARAAMLAAALGILRWGVMATTTAVPVLAVSQLSHGLTFALLHLANMRLIAEKVPISLSATAQTLYGTLGLGVASAVFTVAAGLLYATFGAGAFWAMAGLCVLALPFARSLGGDRDEW